MSQAMLHMYISFAGMLLMFVSAALALFSRTKLRGIVQKVVLSFSFICLVVSGLIVFYIVIGGPTST
ncbi:DUF2768 domain-containing protein [Alkalicoccobacillus porphyridii]|uniref:DUF2768 domain-containing protein n=1 Tax=Alkalicoccobacillus porphyridii TaxID=2597270 RepID=A0A553ZZP8_9BACI|nr:DUF2768 domain-containing protein [Alkalicoccobacillus porphyridii]TSB46903.1 DUF2768 domain-containing protein [Alkalicoccobacillus porphyridii]